MSNHATLSAATQDRKARLAQLKSLKRKQAPDVDQGTDQDGGIQDSSSAQRSRSPSPSIAKVYLSGRNYDADTRGPKLGFDNTPTEGQKTLEAQAATLAEETRKQAEEEEKADKPLDLFKLQPKKPNWDLKRELDRKLEVLNVRTDNAIARLVRERIEKAQKEAKAKNGAGDDGEGIGMDGASLVEAMHLREREEQEAERRAREEDQVEALA